MRGENILEEILSLEESRTDTHENFLCTEIVE
jgi:hypothetical protein